jgi:hypothetical protein
LVPPSFLGSMTQMVGRERTLWKLDGSTRVRPPTVPSRGILDTAASPPKFVGCLQGLQAFCTARICPPRRVLPVDPKGEMSVLSPHLPCLGMRTPYHHHPQIQQG